MENIVKFSVNHWWPGEDYPNSEPFITWLKDLNLDKFLRNDSWCKSNKICVNWCFIDMSSNFCVTATYDWVKENCSCIFGTKFYYSNDSVEDRFGLDFLEYCEENFGSHEIDLEGIYD